MNENFATDTETGKTPEELRGVEKDEEQKEHGLRESFFGTTTNYDKLLCESIVPVGTFVKRDVPEREYIIKPWLQPGTLALVYSGAGVGKTWFAMSIAVAVTTQTNIGKWTVETPVDCLYIDGEMPVQELHKRFKGLSASAEEEKSNLHLLSSSANLSKYRETPILTKEEWRRAIYNFLRSNRSIRLLILDNIACLVPDISENTKKAWDAVNQWLISLRALGVAVIVLHHETKKGEQRGTSARRDNIDIEIHLTRPADYNRSQGARFEAEFTKTRGIEGGEAKPFVFQIVKGENGSFLWEFSYGRKTLFPFIVELIGCGKKQVEIAKLLGCSGAHVTNSKKKAKKEGLLDDDDKLTEDGINTFGGRTFEEIIEEFESD